MNPQPDPGDVGGLSLRLAAAEEGWRRLAREIHDDFGQRLAGLAFSLKAVSKELPQGGPQLAEIDAIGGSLAELGEDLRRLSHGLHPAALERRGLAEALGDLCAETEQRHGLRVALTLADVGETFPPDIGLSLYRIAQEALGNTVRHAGARIVRVTLRATARTARLEIVDDGAGFDPGAARRGVGMTSMEERAQLLGGRCRIASAPGSGTRIEVTMPLPTRDALVWLAESVRRESVELRERLAATYERIYGPEHPQLAKTLLNLGLARATFGEDAAACELLERAVAITEKALAPDHPQHVRALATLADFYFTHGRHAEAEPLYRRLLALHAKGAPYDAWDTVLANSANR